MSIEPRKAVVYIHSAVIGRISERLGYYISLFKNSGLYEYVENIYICYVGDSASFPLHVITSADPDSKISVKQVSTNLESYELPTQCEMYKFSCSHPNYNVLYIHTKGIHGEVNPCIEDWVTYMAHFNIVKWRDCIAALQTSRSCGVDLRDFPVLHYSGNFWWGRADHISSLPTPLDFADLGRYPNPIGSARHNQEFWICYASKREEHCGLWETDINCYERHLHRYEPQRYK